MFILLRRIERWLHQHIFKVGWLLTHNYQTTTIFYYTIFLPGVVLHELIYWLAAGMLNVRAERAIKWPEAQEVGELKLNFVQLNPRANVFRKAIITIAPLLFGLISIWYIAHNIFDITAVFRQMSSGNLRDVVTAFEMLLNAPLFWLWIYVIFTIANTMYPSIPKDLQGWRSVLLGLGTVALALLLLGLGGEIFEALQSPVSELIFVLQATFALMIAVDILMVLVLGLMEYTIERTTGNSATFRGGKMITVTREEAQEEQRKQREAELKEQAKKRNPAADGGIKSIYALAFSIPSIPPQEPITLLREHSQASIEMPAIVIEEEEKKPATMPLFGGIAANAPEAPKPISAEEKALRESIAAKINVPERITTLKPATSEEKAAEVAPNAETPSKVVAQPIATVPAPEAEKRQSSLFDKLGTSEIEKASTEKPAAALGAFSRPAISTSKEDNAETEDTSEEKPLASRFGGFSKPAISSPKEDDGDTEIPEEKPVASRFGGFSKPVTSVPKEENASTEDTPEEKPVASRFGGFSKPAISTAKEDDAETEDTPEEKPVASRFGGFTKPAISAPKEDDTSTEETPEEKPIASRFGGFSKPAISSPKEDDDGETEKPIASRFGGFSKPAISKPKEEDADTETPEEKPVASRFGGFTKPVISAPKEDDTDTETAEEKLIASRFGGFSKPAISKPKEEDADTETPEEKPVTSRFGGFTKPAISAPKEDDTSIEEAKPSTSRFSFNKAASEESSTSRFGASPFKPIGEGDKEEKSTSSAARFASTEFRRIEADDEDEAEEKPSSSSPFSRTSAFGTSRPAPKPFGKAEDEDDSENEDEEISRPSAPLLGRQSPFGAPRPAPKPFSRADDEDEDDSEDEEISRPSAPLLGRQSPFGAPRPAPKPFSKMDEDEDDSEDDEAPRSRVSGFGLLGKRPSDAEIVYEDDEDDFRNFGDDEDYVPDDED